MDISISVRLEEVLYLLSSAIDPMTSEAVKFIDYRGGILDLFDKKDSGKRAAFHRQDVNDCHL